MITSLMLLPPDIFPPDLQPIIYFTLLPLALILGLIIVGFVYFVWLPPTAKMYMWNKLKKRPIMDYETEDGVRGQEMVKPYSEGINYGMKTGNTYLTPRPISNELVYKVLTPELEELEAQLKAKKMSDAEIKEAIEKRLIKEIRDIRDMERVVLRPSVDKDLGVPVYRTYQSKAIATTLAHIIGLEYDGESKTTSIAVPLIKKTGQRIEPIELNLGKDSKTGEWIMKTSLPVDPNVVKKWFKYMWTQSQIKASNRISEEIGRDKEAGMWKKYIYIIAGMIIIMAIFFIAVIIGTG